MIGLDGALVGAETHRLSKAATLDTGHGDVSRITAIGDDSPSMNQSVSGEIVEAATPAIGQHGGPRATASHRRMAPNLRRRIRNTKHPYPSEAPGRSQLDGDRNQRLASRTTGHAFTAMFLHRQPGFINSTSPAPGVVIWTNHRRAKRCNIVHAVC